MLRVFLYKTLVGLMTGLRALVLLTAFLLVAVDAGRPKAWQGLLGFPSQDFGMDGRLVNGPWFAHGIPSLGLLTLDGWRLTQSLLGGVFFLKTLVWMVGWTMGHGFAHYIPSIGLLMLDGSTLGQGGAWCFLSQDSGRDR